MLKLKETPINKEIEEHILMLENPDKKHFINMKREMCPNNKDAILESKIGEKLEKERVASQLKTLEGKYEQVFTKNDIHKECQMYNLAFIEAKNFTGEMTLHLIERIKKFIDDNEIKLFENDLRYSFFLLATQPYTRTKNKVFKQNTKDPLVLYKFMEKKEEFFIMIDGNKNYVNFYNRLLGFKNYNKPSCAIFYICLVIILCNLLIIPFDIPKWTFLIAIIPAFFIGMFTTDVDKFNYYNIDKFPTNEN